MKKTNPAREKKVANDMQYVPDSKKSIMKRAFAGTASPRGAIKAKCLDCVGFENVSETIGNCTCYGCPIWSYRPYQTKEVGNTEDSDQSDQD
jgi:hypothetical protein